MKKLRWGVLILMLFALSGCGAPKETAEPGETSAETTAETEPSQESTAQETEAEDVWSDFKLSKLTSEEKANLKVDIYIIAGQSNAAGSTDIDYNLKKEERDRTTYKNVFLYYSRRDTDGSYQRNIKFANVKEGQGYNESTIGPELGMASYLSPQYKTTDRIALILKVAAGGTSIINQIPEKEGISTTNKERFLARGSWLPSKLDPEPEGDYFRPTGFLAREFRTNLQECVDSLLSMGCKKEHIRFSALCWMQGEDDRADSHYQVYAEYFRILAEEFRQDATEISGKDCSEMPIIIGEISETFGSAKEADILRNKRFIEVQRALPETVGQCYVIPTKDFALNEMQGGASVAIGTDTYHWNYKDMLMIGKLFGESAFVHAGME